MGEVYRARDPLDSSQALRLLPDVSSAVYVEPGYILFARDGVLTACPFDAASGRITGDALALGEKVTLHSANYLAAFSASATGTIALRQALPFEDMVQGRWISRDGAFLGNVAEPRPSSSGAVSPSGRLVAFGITEPRTGNSDVWISDAKGGNLRRLVASLEWEGFPSWSPDETRVAYTTTGAGGAGIKVQDLNGGEPAVLIEATDQAFVRPLSWSPNGEYLLYLRQERSGKQADLYTLSFSAKTTTVFVATPLDERTGMFSPDGKWVAYASEDSNTSTLWVARFPGHGERRHLATDVIPISWGANGRELLGFSGGSGHLIAIPIAVSANGVVSGTPTTLISTPTTFGPRIAPVADHSRFLVGARPDPENGVAEIRLIRGLLNRLRANGASK
jgi:hypothetical protein